MKNRIILFTTPECGPCKAIKPKAIVKGAEIIDASTNALHKYPQMKQLVRSVPTAFLVDEHNDILKVETTPKAIEELLEGT